MKQIIIIIASIGYIFYGITLALIALYSSPDEKVHFLFYGDFGMFLAYNLNYHFRIVCGIMPL